MAAPVYLDCAATTPIEPSVEESVIKFLRDEFGNAGSRTHEFGTRAKAAVEKARDQLAAVLEMSRDEVIFTSGATESDNLAILGLADAARTAGRMHFVTSRSEHKAVLEPMQHLEAHGFRVSYLDPGPDGFVAPETLKAALTPDTYLVSLMHVNNETGVIQPISDYAEVLAEHDAYFHVDAAQSFGKGSSDDLKCHRVDLISVSGHKLYAPKGIGALFLRRREFNRPPIAPLMHGGGQERGLRPGTLPVAMIVGFGTAAELAIKNRSRREKACTATKEAALRVLQDAGGAINGSAARSVSTTINVSFPGLDSEALMVALKPFIAVSNGSACTSSSYSTSHVLKAMNLPEARIKSALRFSWCHLTPPIPWSQIHDAITKLRTLAEA